MKYNSTFISVLTKVTKGRNVRKSHNSRSVEKRFGSTHSLTVSHASEYNKLSSVNANEPLFDEMPEALSFDVSSLLHMPDEQRLNNYKHLYVFKR